MKVYHGSKRIIELPGLTLRNHYNDQGKGFYLTKEQDLAREWACGDDRDGFVNCYELDMGDLAVLDLTTADYGLLNWLSILTKHRGMWQRHTLAEEAKNYIQNNYSPDVADVDVIIGYRADDSYFSMALDFLNGRISLQQLGRAMKLDPTNVQLVLKSQKAISQIDYRRNELAQADCYYQKRAARDLNLRRAYEQLVEEKTPGESYIDEMLRGMVNEDELRVR